jgi:hypothetical protein
MSARSVYGPHRAMLARADEAIARLTPALAGERGRARTRADLLAQLRAPIRPRVGWLLVLLFGWLAWTAGAFVFAHRAIDEEERPPRMPA